mmetsp:Transcript_93777/g.262351  ORF Transcript_93777/g.262351 Transcript_93777/m.262351 type:complete len:219 (-) Transcript_93777:52-708(-)
MLLVDGDQVLQAEAIVFEKVDGLCGPLEELVGQRLAHKRVRAREVRNVLGGLAGARVELPDDGVDVLRVREHQLPGLRECQAVVAVHLQRKGRLDQPMLGLRQEMPLLCHRHRDEEAQRPADHRRTGEDVEDTVELRQLLRLGEDAEADGEPGLHGVVEGVGEVPRADVDLDLGAGLREPGHRGAVPDQVVDDGPEEHPRQHREGREHQSPVAPEGTH